MRTDPRVSVLAALALIAALAWPSPADAICGRKSCVVGSGGGGGGGGGYDPFGGMGGMMDMMFGAMQAIQAQQQQMNLQNARNLNQRGIALYNNNDLVAAAAAFRQALQYAPSDQTIRANLQNAEQALANLRAKEAARQKAEREALQRKIGGLLDNLAGGLAAEGNAGTSAASDFAFAPAGSSFFGLGGGAPAPKIPNGAPVAGGPRPAGGTGPRYDAPNDSPAGAPLDFAGAETLYEKGSVGSAPVDFTRGLPDKPVSIPRTDANGLDFAQADTIGRAPGSPILSEPPLQADPIVYRSHGFKAWAVRTFSGPLTQGAVESGLASQKIPELAMGEKVAKSNAPEPPKPPFEVSDSLDGQERRAREIANLGFERVGEGQYDSAIRFFEVAREQAPDDPRIEQAFYLTRDLATLKVEPLHGKGAAEGPDRRVAEMWAVQGYAALTDGKYEDAAQSFELAASLDPGRAEYTQRRLQAKLGLVLAGQ